MEGGGCLRREMGVPQEGGRCLRREAGVSGEKWVPQGDKLGHRLLVRKILTYPQAPGGLGRKDRGTGRSEH